MTFNDYFKNPKLYKVLADEVNSSCQLQNSFRSAIEQISSVSKYQGLLGLSGNVFDNTLGLEAAGLSTTDLHPTVSLVSTSYRKVQDFLVSPLQTAAVGSAIRDGFQFGGLTESLKSAYKPLFKHQLELEETRGAIRDLLNTNMSFADRLKTSVYIKQHPAVESLIGAEASVAESVGSVTKAVAGISAMTGAFSSVHGDYDGTRSIVDSIVNKSSLSQSLIDTSWLRDDSPWRTCVKTLTEVNTDALDGTKNLFTRLLDAEKETGRLFGLTSVSTEATKVTSAAAQIASILQTENLGSINSWYGHGSISELLLGYSGFALNQHKEIQRALTDGRDKDAEWRVGLLDVTSKFVDRQAIWENEVITGVSDECENIIDEPDEHEETVECSNDQYYETIEKNYDDYDLESVGLKKQALVFTVIPQEVGYSKREDSQVDVEEALERSRLLTITELGKGIVNGVRAINQGQEDRGREDVFRLTRKNIWFLIDLGMSVCDSEYTFGEMIDHLYFLFYENLERIKVFAGGGDKKKGDDKVRNEDVYQCVFRVKAIRSDLRHDLEHGSEKEIKVKRERTQEAYLHYANKRPRTAKEYKQFQIRLYEEIAALLRSLQAMEL